MEFGLTIKLSKSDFGQATINYLGYVVGNGEVAQIKSKVQGIFDFRIPENKKALMRFLGMASYYRRFCKNFVIPLTNVVIPLANLLKKRKDFVWDNQWQVAFDKVKSMYSNPVLTAHNLEKPFKLEVDASDLGISGVLLQDDEQGLEHPVC